MLTEKEFTEVLKENFSMFCQEIYDLHKFIVENPELGGEEFLCSKKMVDILEKHGIETEYPFAGLPTSFIGRINPQYKQRAVIIAEYDALRGLGHACGHSASGCASIMAALAINQVKDKLWFGIDIMGTPDEEINGCKEQIAAQNYFDIYDFAIMVHLGEFNTVNVNFIALDGLGFIWRGKAAHAASTPESGANSLNAARLFLDATDMMRQHIIPEARMHGFIKNGGSASNIVPDFAEIEFLTRAPKRKDLNEITEWVKTCGVAAAMMTKTKLDFFLVGAAFHELHVSEYGMEIMGECFREMNLKYDTKAGMVGSSDIGNVDYKCPAFHPIMGIGQGCKVHTKQFADRMKDCDIDNIISLAAEYIITFISKLYTNEEILERVKREHKEYRGY